MTTTIAAINPIQGLLDYIQDVKPYHTKVVEILTEYIHTDEVNISIGETFSMNVEFIFPNGQRPEDFEDDGASITSERFGGFGGNTPFGTPDPAAWPAIPFNVGATGLFDPVYAGYDSVANTVIIPGDRTSQYAAGRSITVVVYNNTTVPFTEIDSTNYEVLSSQYILPVSSLDTPHTLITVANLTDQSVIQAGNFTDAETYITVTLTPFDIGSIVFGYAGASVVEYTDVPPGTGTPLPDTITQVESSMPDENLFDPIRVNSFVVTGADVTQVFVTGSTIELTSTGDIYRVLYSIFESGDTLVRVVETIPASTSITGATLKVREQIPGYDDSFLTSAESEGTLSTVIADSISFSWNDTGENDVLYGYQYLIQTSSGNTLNVNGTNLEFTVQVGDDVQIIDNPTINGTYSVTGVSGSTITISPALPASQGGYVEKYVP